MKALKYVVASAVVIFAMQAKASSIPYPDTGTVVAPYVAVAVNTGYIDAWFYGYNAADTDEIQIVDLTTDTSSGWFFTNNTTTVGTEITDVLNVNAGDILEFELQNVTQGDIVSSIPSDSPDGINHAYATAWPGGDIPTTDVYVPATVGGTQVTFVGFEDKTIGPPQNSDLDYNDDQFLFDNVAFNTTTPEPGSIFLLGTGLLGLAGIVRRKFNV